MRAFCHSIGRGLLSLLVPAACPACGVGIHDWGGVCSECARSLARAWRRADEIELPERVCAGLSYEGACRGLIHRMKYEGDPTATSLLAELILLRLRERDLDLRGAAIVPVPLHPIRRRERGFNQSERLARRIAARSPLVLCPDLLERIRYGRSQTALDPGGRRISVAGAFRTRRPPPDRRLILLDDVWTTGATARSCLDALRTGGAVGEIWVAVGAAAPAPDPSD